MTAVEETTEQYRVSIEGKRYERLHTYASALRMAEREALTAIHVMIERAPAGRHPHHLEVASWENGLRQ